LSTATQIVAIDGPAGAGKSTVARRAAQALGIAFLDTGAMYRAATWYAMHKGVNLDDPQALAACTRAMPLTFSEASGGMRVFVDGEDISEAIRTPEVTRQIYRLDEIPEVRNHLVALQREVGEAAPHVAEGRDIGTVVFPRAACKIYMDAAPEERARRRAEELRAKGQEVDEAALAEEIRQRDTRAMNREHAPLRRAEDAILLDTTHLDLDAVVEKVVALAKERLC
jgi:cytidylate kinase